MSRPLSSTASSRWVWATSILSDNLGDSLQKIVRIGAVRIICRVDQSFSLSHVISEQLDLELFIYDFPLLSFQILSLFFDKKFSLLSSPFPVQSLLLSCQVTLSLLVRIRTTLRYLWFVSYYCNRRVKASAVLKESLRLHVILILIMVQILKVLDRNFGLILHRRLWLNK